MAKKDSNADVVPKGPPADIVLPNVWYVVGIGVIVWIVYRSGYDSGVNVSRKILKRHDKDVKNLEKKAAKREKQLRKELSPETEEKWKWWPW